jgi:membrane protease YdiL (CAAX protease family)
MNDNPWSLVGMMVATAVAFGLWWRDFRAQRAGADLERRAFPGTSPCPARVVGLAIGGILILLGAEVGGEYALGIVADQKPISVLFGLYTLAAAFLEELVFRGYLVVENRGRAVLWLSITSFSVAFALAHPFLWEWRSGILSIHLTQKAVFTTSMLFLASVWFYFMRYVGMNPQRSLLPCIAAHLAKNLGVFVLKALQGFVVAWW